MNVCVLGAGGFVGAAVRRALQQTGINVTPIAAPRISRPWGAVPERGKGMGFSVDAVAALEESLRGYAAVVNCAGIADPGAETSRTLYGANALMPIVVREACFRAGVGRFVHVSSAAVQGDRDILDETEDVSPLTPYARSKAAGERLLLRGNREGLIVFRPTSVHGSARTVTVRLARFARSPLSSVAGSGEWPSPQVLVQNVASAVAYLVVCSDAPPSVVIQPSEGQTAASVLRVLSLGFEPHHLPEHIAHAGLAAAAVAKSNVRLSAARRRLQMVWFGQRQTVGWLSSQGFSPPAGADAWSTLAAELSRRDLRATC
jgi:UDP-glucose 4-epimerase